MINLSVVIPTYNRPLLLKRAIRSVLKQADHDSLSLEIVVVDDGSAEQVDTDNFREKNIRYIRLERNSGPHIARNKGIEIASGNWIIMLDDDDELIENTLSNAIRRIQEIKDYTTYPVFFFATTKGHIPGAFAYIQTVDILNETLKGDFTPVIQRETFRSYGYRYRDYPEILGVGCELLTWLNISLSHKIPAFNDALVRVNEDAPLRLTSYDNFIRNSDKFALQQDLTIQFLEERQLDTLCPAFIQRKYLGAATYYLLSGKRELSRERLRAMQQFFFSKTFIMVLSYLPLAISKFFFRNYKLRFSK